MLPSRGMMTNQTKREPEQIIKQYFKPTMYPSPNTAAPVFTLNTSFVFSASISPQPMIRVEMVSVHQPKVLIKKSYNPPTNPLTANNFAWFPFFSPETSTSVVAVASGKGYFPCISFTKYLRKGISIRIPNNPPSKEDKKI